MRTLTLILAGLALALVGSSVWAAPIIDGNVGGTEYAFILQDTAPETAYVANLDIDKFRFDSTNAYYNVGLTVTSPPVDKTGGVTSPMRRSEFWTVFRDFTNTTDLYVVDVLMNAAGPLMFTLEDCTNGTVVFLSLADVAVQNAIEWRVAKTLMPLLPDHPYVEAQLDNRGAAEDDQITGVVPEPATLALLGLGAAAAAFMRRRK